MLRLFGVSERPRPPFWRVPAAVSGGIDLFGFLVALEPLGLARSDLLGAWGRHFAQRAREAEVGIEMDSKPQILSGSWLQQSLDCGHLVPGGRLCC